jgi:hypothetical protein
MFFVDWILQWRAYCNFSRTNQIGLTLICFDKLFAILKLC